MTPFKRLFEPLRLGPLTLRNRIVMAPHRVSFMAGYGDAAQRVIDYHIDRAKGGAAMLVMSNFVVPQAWLEHGSWGGQLKTSPLGGLSVANDPALVPAFRRLAQGVHEHGAAFISQLNAGGRQHFVTGAQEFGLPLYAPSALPCPKTRQIPKAMDQADIAGMVACFAEAAVNLRESGADGVELLAAQGYLLSEFLSPHTNHRNDEYGGSLENRLRIVVESLQAMRRAAGRDFIVGVRINGEDHNPGGLVLDESIAMARALQASGLIDYLNISGMTGMQQPGWIADITAPEGMFAEHSGRIRAAVPGLPVAVAGRVGTPQAAEAILAAGQADMVAMARALIADPELPNKALRGDVDDIRKCTYSNQSCLMSISQGRGVGCLQNVAVGKEAQIGIGKLKPAVKVRRVVVVGAGPAGMAAARVAAERGHQVTLYEKDDTLGGQNRMTSRIASRRGFAEVTRWQEHRLRRSGVTLITGVTADAARVLADRPDVVVVATGSRPRRDGYSSFRPEVPMLPGADRPHVQTVWDVFARPEAIGGSVLLIDEDPHLSGVFTAEYLAAQGKQVSIVTPHLHPGAELHLNFAGEVYERLMPLGVAVHPHTLTLSIDRDSVTCKDRYSERLTVLRGIDTVVLAMGNLAEDALARALAGRVSALHSVGDCLTPRRIDDAIREGERVGWMI